MASNLPGACCIQGSVHEDGTPAGRDVRVGGYAGYLAVPAAARAHAGAGLLYLPDLFSLGPHSRRLADRLAARGYLTLVVDLLDGDAPPRAGFDAAAFDFPRYLAHGSTGRNPHTPAAVDPIVRAGVRFLREEMGVTKLGAHGYCFGAKYVARHAPDFQAGYMAHPSWVSEEELAGFRAPLSIAAAADDSIFPAERRRRSEAILAQRGPASWQINVYGGVQHGFATRADPGQKVQRWAREQAFAQAVAWYDTWLLDDA